jgi:hypothetical protein
LATNEMAAASWQATVSHFLFFTRELLTKNNMTVVSHPPYFSLFFRLKKTERQPFWHNWGDRDRISGGGVQQPHRTRIPGCI